VDITNLALLALSTLSITDPDIASNEQTNGSQEPGERERRGDGAPATAWRLGKRLAAERATRLGTAAAMSPTAAARASEESGEVGACLLASESSSGLWRWWCSVGRATCRSERTEKWGIFVAQ